MNQWSDTQKRWKAFPLRWELYEEYNNETEELKRLTPFQVGILLAAVKPYRWASRWIDLGISETELDKQISEIEDRLMREETGGEMATQEDIAKGMYQAFNWLALQIASGGYQNLNITTDADGVVTLPSGDADSDVELPDDDPATTDIDESMAAKAGGVINVRLGLNGLWASMNTWYAASVTNPVMQTRLDALYDWVDATALDTFVDFYYTVRGTGGTVPTTAANTMDSYLFCKGVKKSSVSDWAIVNTTTTIQEQWLNLMVALADTQLSTWYESGIDTPSLNYKDYSCVPSPSETINMPVLGTTYTTNTSWKASHRLSIRVRNYFTDTTDGDVLDFWYYDTVAALPVNRIATVNIQQGSGITKPTVNVVPFKSNHDYSFTIDTVSAGQMQITVPATSMTTPVASVVGVGFQVDIVDLGEIGV